MTRLDAEVAATIAGAYTTADDVLVAAVYRARRGEAPAALVRALHDLAAAIETELDAAGELRHGELSIRALDAAEAAVIAAAAADDGEVVL